MGFFSIKDEEDRIDEVEMNAKFQAKEAEYNRKMTEKFCPIVRENCIGVGCVHFQKSWTVKMPDMKWYKTMPAKCKLWKE